MCVSSVFVLLYDVLCASSSPPLLVFSPLGDKWIPSRHSVQCARCSGSALCTELTHTPSSVFTLHSRLVFSIRQTPPPTHPPPFPRFLVSKGETQLLALVDKLKGEGLDHHLWIEQPEGIATTPATTPTSPPTPPPQLHPPNPPSPTSPLPPIYSPSTPPSTPPPPQPEGIPTCVALRPYPREVVAPVLKKYQLFK